MLLPAVAFAQAAGETELKAIVVEGVGPKGAKPTTMDAVGAVQGIVPKATVSGSKTATSIAEIPQSVSVVGRSQINMIGAEKVDQAIAYTSGAHAATYGPDSRYNWFSIRGVQAEARGSFMDGLPLFQYAFGGFYTDAYFLERIEVIKGPASALYGGASIGGIVNQISKRPTGERLREVETGINSFGNGYGAIDLGDVSADGTVSYRLTSKVSGGGYFTDKTEDFRVGVAPSITWSPDEATELTVLTSYNKVDGMHSGSFLPYVGTVVSNPNYGKIPTDFFYGDKNDDSFKSDQTMLGYEFKHEFDNGMIFRQNLRWNHVESSERGPYTYDTDASDTVLDRIGFGVNSNVDLFTIDNQLETQFDTGAASHTLLLGADYKRYNINHQQWTYSATGIDVLNPDYTNSRLGPNSIYLNEDLTVNQFGVYAQDQIRFGEGFIATLNGRYDWIDTDVESGPTAYSTGTSTQEANSHRFSGRAGLGYEFDNGVTPYIAYTNAYDPSIGTDADGNIFKPTVGRQYEVGVKYQPTMFDGLITASYFDMTRTNVAVTSVSNPFAKVQVGEVGYKGFEFETQANVADGLRLIAALTLMDIGINEDENQALIGKVPFQTAEKSASLWLDYAFQNEKLAGWSVGAGVRWTGPSYADEANTQKVPDYTVVDAAVRYEAKTWGASLNVTNLFDKDYVVGCGGSLVCSYGEGQKFVLKVNAKF